MICRTCRSYLGPTGLRACACGVGRSDPIEDDRGALAVAAPPAPPTTNGRGAPVDPGPAALDWPAFWAESTAGAEWLVEPLLPRGRSIATYSVAKVGKSLLALDVAARLATGSPVLDQPAGPPLSVVYLDLEMTLDDLRERLEDLGYGPDDDLANLHYYLLPSLPPLDTQAGGDAVLRIVQRHQGELLVIDTTSRVLVGKENDADTLRAYHRWTGARVKALGVTTWRLDHAGKDLDRGQRGTSGKNDDVDLVWELTAQDEGHLRLRATHRRQGWIPEVLDLVRRDDPLRHELTVGSWPAGTLDLANTLNSLNIPLNYGARRVRQLLRAADIQARNAVIAAAIRYRKTCPQTSGTRFDDEEGTRAGDT